MSFQNQINDGTYAPQPTAIPSVPSEALLAEAFAEYLKREDKHFMFKATREEVQEAFLAGVAWTLASPAGKKISSRK